MNYCILNGVKSNSVRGLLIQSLPPISKPLMRAQVEEIDGRDGDITTKLGYSAYDKEMTIGLFGKYNVDDCIRFFDSEGIVTFSNEPDKFYQYEIINQIDFERLIRFKTATVTFHCQPFKYSAVERKFTYNNQLMKVKDYSATKNGITLSVVNGQITATGTGTTATEFYVPIDKTKLDAGSYILSATAKGTNASSCSIRVIDGVPSDAKSFGGTSLRLQNNATATLDDTDAGSLEYDFLWFYITPNAEMDFSLDMALMSEDASAIKVINRGNVASRPNITIFGVGLVNLNINGTQVLTLNIDDEFITINSAQMNAYQGETLKNRQVVGNYEDVTLRIGTNTISWNGFVTEVIVEDFSRWI